MSKAEQLIDAYLKEGTSELSSSELTRLQSFIDDTVNDVVDKISETYFPAGEYGSRGMLSVKRKHTPWDSTWTVTGADKREVEDVANQIRVEFKTTRAFAILGDDLRVNSVRRVGSTFEFDVNIVW